MQTKQTFLEQKAENFKNYLLQFSPSQEVIDYANNFSKETLIPTILTTLVPVITSGSQGAVADSLIEKLVVKDEQERQAVKDKILAYFNCFYTVVMQE